MGNITDVWEFIKENPQVIGIPLSERKGLDLLSALRDVYETNKTNHDAAQNLLTLLANVLVASAQGDGDAIVQEVIIQDAMMDLDNSLKGILDEGR
jgi:hypothetical protein